MSNKTDCNKAAEVPPCRTEIYLNKEKQNQTIDETKEKIILNLTSLDK